MSLAPNSAAHNLSTSEMLNKTFTGCITASKPGFVMLSRCKIVHVFGAPGWFVFIVSFNSKDYLSVNRFTTARA